MHRFLCPDIDPQAAVIELKDRNEIHHLKDVLRLKSGDAVSLFDGKGKEVSGKILSIQKNMVRVKIIEIQKGPRQTTPAVILACAIPKKAKFETIIEKCTELGADEIVPMYTRRTEVVFKSEQTSKKLQRYKTVCANAAKQSQRQTLPVIHPPVKFGDYLRQVDATATVFIPHLAGHRQSLSEAFQKNQGSEKLIFLIGPEGDFTPEEVELAARHGAIPVSLGSTVLKVDTAAIAVIACANLFFKS